MNRAIYQYIAAALIYTLGLALIHFGYEPGIYLSWATAFVATRIDSSVLAPLVFR